MIDLGYFADNLCGYWSVLYSPAYCFENVKVNSSIELGMLINQINNSFFLASEILNSTYFESRMLKLVLQKLTVEKKKAGICGEL